MLWYDIGFVYIIWCGGRCGGVWLWVQLVCASRCVVVCACGMVYGISVVRWLCGMF